MLIVDMGEHKIVSENGRSTNFHGIEHEFFSFDKPTNLSDLGKVCFKEVENHISPETESLNLAGCYELKITEEEMATLKEKLPSLAKLILCHCTSLKVETINEFVKFPNLRTLNVYSTKIDNTFMETIATSNIESLNLGCNDFLRDDDIIQLTKSELRLQKLVLSQCFKLSDTSINAIAGAFGEFLKHLDVSHCDVTDESCKILSTEFKCLEYLNICYCDKIVSFDPLITLKGTLKSLVISEKEVKKMGHLVGNLPRLEKLQIMGEYHALDCSFIKKLAMTCKNLTNLYLKDMGDIKDDSIKMLAERCCKLEILHLNGCGFTRDGGQKRQLVTYKSL